MAPNCQPSKIDKLKSTRKDQRGWPSEVHWYFMAQFAISCSQLPRHRLGACDGRFISSIHSRTPAWCTGKHQLHELFLRSNSFNDFASSDPHHGISSHIFLNIFWHFTQLSIWHLFWHSICNSFWQSIWYLLYLQILRSDVTCLLHPVESISNIFGLKCSCQATLARKLPDTCHIFWHSVCCIFEDSLWPRSGWEHSDPVLAVRVPRGRLRSIACSWGPAEEEEDEDAEKEEKEKDAGRLT